MLTTTRSIEPQPATLSPVRERFRAIAFANFAAGHLDVYCRMDGSPAHDLAYTLSQYANLYARYHAEELIVLARSVMRAIEHKVPAHEIADAMYTYAERSFSLRAPMA